MAEGSAAGGPGDDFGAVLRDVALHNLRTPLSVAEGATALLRDHGDRLSDEQRRNLFASIETAHRRIREMAESALGGHATDAQAPPTPVEVDARALLDELIADLRDTGPVQLRGEVADDVPAVFPGDPRTVRHALENLVTNAIKVSPDGASVTVTARRTENGVSFEVTDEGPGIPSDRLTQLLAGNKHGGRGLTLVRRLVEGRGGELGVISTPGEGSTFWVTFPAERP